MTRSTEESIREAILNAQPADEQVDMSKAAGDEPAGRAPQSAVLLGITSEVELFHAADDTGFARINRAGHVETWPVRSKGFADWMRYQFFKATGGAPNSEALSATLNVLEARARFESDQRDVHVRIAVEPGNIHIDLGDSDWRAIKVLPGEWRISEAPSVMFQRAPGVQPLSFPARGGSIENLRRFLNLMNEGDYVLVVAWLLAVLRGRGPYPVLVVTGEQGAAKSTFCEMLRSIVDPNVAALRALPRDERDLYISGTKSHVLAFDNVSSLPAWLSDALCRIATGSGFSARRLFSDDGEVLFNLTRPVLINGIEDVVTRADLADRAIHLRLSPIPDDQRRPKEQIWSEYQAELPGILGALLDIVAVGLQQAPSTVLDRMPRMADFAAWIAACETAVWPLGTFAAAYEQNRKDAIADVIDADPVASGVRDLVAETGEWEGTATRLLALLIQRVERTRLRVRHWPETPSALSNRISRSTTFLRKSGIEVEFLRVGRLGTRHIRISPSAPSAPSAK